MSLIAHEPMLVPELKLWRAVLEQAYADAELPPVSDSKSAAARQIRAQRFLRAASPQAAASLHLVCELAHVPFDRLVLWARKKYPNNPREIISTEEIEEMDPRDESDELYWELASSFQTPESVA